MNLDILRVLRESASLNQGQAAQLCGLTSKQGRLSLAAWERGDAIPQAKRRPLLIRYLWDHLGLRQDPAQFDAVWEMLAEEWGWEPIGEREWSRLTNQARPIRPCSDITGGRTSQPNPFQAPASIPHFVGRQDELEAAHQLLTADSGPSNSTLSAPPSTIALIGMGGIGKTTLAIHVAHALRDHFADGVLWANAAITNPLDIAQSWATAYGYDFSGLADLESRAAAIRNVLAEKHALVIFDDVVDASTVRPLLPTGKEGGDFCRVLLTTRNHDIASSLNAQPITPPELTIDAGVDLLTRVLGASRVHAELSSAQRICQIVEGLPLAVEIVAQRLSSRPQQTLGKMVGRLEDAAKRLDSLQISDKAVRTAFEVSWGQLDQELRYLFSLIGIFEGQSFTMKAFAYIAQMEEAIAEEAIWELQALSLVSFTSIKRFQQHALLTDFALEKLDCKTPYYLSLAQYFLEFLQNNIADNTLLKAEWETIHFALSTSFRLEQWHLVLGYAEKLSNLWFLQAEYTRARQGYPWIVEAAALINDQKLTAHYLVQWGRVCFAQNSVDECHAHLINGLDIAKKIHDVSIAAEAQYILACFYLQQGKHEDTDELLTEAHNAYLALDDHCGHSKVLTLRAELFFRVGGYDQATELCMQALTSQEANGDALELIETLQTLIDINLAQRDYVAANKHLAYLQKQVEQNDFPAKIGECYLSLAQINRRLGQWDQALRWAKQSEDIFRRIGKLSALSHSLFEQFVVVAQTDDQALGVKLGYASLRLMTQINDSYSRVICLKRLGDFHRQNNNPVEAKKLWAEGKELAISLQHPVTAQFDERLQSLPAM